jgi:hypothetical protein
VNYQKIYDLLINRARNRILKGYLERHHIIPRCMGGNNAKSNLVDLTPEEHYVCHQLLVKIYPKHSGLIKAATQMTRNNNTQLRNNKLYGWLRRKLSETMSEAQAGKGNSQYGKCWISNGIENTKINKNDHIPPGWFKGRTVVKDKNRKCHICKNIYYYLNNDSRYCSKECHQTYWRLKKTGKLEKSIRSLISDELAKQMLVDYENGISMKELLIKYNKKCEQSFSSFLTKRFPNRKRFAPGKREKKNLGP